MVIEFGSMAITVERLTPSSFKVSHLMMTIVTLGM